MAFDLSVFKFIHGFAGMSNMLDFIGVFFANYLPYILAVALLVFALKRNGVKNKLLAIFYFIFTGIVSRYVLTSIIRLIIPRERPFYLLKFIPLIPESGSSFPSGHAAFFFAMAFVLLALDRKWGVWFLVLATLNGISRIFVGVHWPTDILGGVVVGFLTYLIFKFLFLRGKRNDETENTADGVQNKLEENI